MDENVEIPDDSMQHVEALLSRHPPQLIQRMFQQVIDSRRNSIASSYNSSSSSSLRSRLSSRLSIASSFSTASNASSEIAPSIASSNSSRSRRRHHEPRSYPTGFDPTRPVPAVLTPCSETGSPLDTKMEPSFTPTEEDMSGISSPVTYQSSKDLSLSGESYMFCTYCAELKVLKTFKAKSDWKKHEMRMHETGEDWPCTVNGCSRIFDRQKDFLKHHQRYHSGRPLPSLTDIRIQLLPRRVFGCGFEKCKEVSIGWDERCDHVAKHMKNGSSMDQWKYSNVIRNLIRQEALHDAWKEMISCLNERLRESRSQISWCPDNTRVLRQKLQCCDLRPSREEVLVTALSLRSDILINLELPPGFVVPSRDSVPNVDQISREHRMQILIGTSNAPQTRARLQAVNTALLQACNISPDTVNFDASPFGETDITTDTDGRRISYMDLDPGDFLDLTQQEIPMPPALEPHTSHQSHQSQHSQQSHPSDSPTIHSPMDPEPVQNPAFTDPGKAPNPLGWCYPNYFDAPPSFEESPYYDRPSLGQMFSKPLRKIGLSRRESPHSRTPSQDGQNGEMQHDFSMPPPMQTMSMHHPQPHHYRGPEQVQVLHGLPHDQLHLFTSQS
ncbi:hypothetical protein P154DRAFT_521127 [Amniculicola lignicola CBS 123094]|uniref:C2H2-type domain-containing protein n=1 Tax=Amniculicola lignicola CBS 123094 TaxID=1392246 RepID=A0A6A5WTB7_9PLEO|nr:hypothetical protein P154DRAFT_521127 [Amniculicola lignicola CBS 123094]